MPKITLLDTRTVEFNGTKDLERLIRNHRKQLEHFSQIMDQPHAVPHIQAISHNLVHLTREYETIKSKRNRRSAKIHILPGGKKD